MNRPKIIINCAMSLDGKIASATGKQVRISSEEDMARVYQLRNKVDAVLVGINTVINDDPKLTVKERYVSCLNQPIRIVLDPQNKTPETALIVSDKAKTIIVVDENTTISKTYRENVTVLPFPTNNGVFNLRELGEKLCDLGITSLLVEGGGTVIWNFITNHLVDDLYVYVGSLIIGGKQTPTMAMGNGFKHSQDFIKLQHIDTKSVGDGLLLHYQLKK
ncbi:MAG: 2,5-diamino-6-(ribosylamino)-4(3H)-pyrimidinone 5'-phosphate reductase [Candidatus Thermoplasmatota archaeon]|nr:2,5-diamino-6-(ribosylamino)-4(3H)-pyrimidinone 5'-phosphate reductase [Candidatus Thermoplasmatota archaeon]MBS3801973.1 2,5-diamino-6-(ribosylamino)-4(3H)-pyrimidinone 5'-phosphate reductase [Candidatus Thermoplasmatota archaeon]